MSAAKEKLSVLLSAYFCGRCGYLGSESPDHPGCSYSAFRDRRYHMAVDLEKRLEAVTEALNSVRKELFENMGRGHVIKYEGRFVELWHKDPMFKGEETGKKIQEYQTLVHRSLVELTDVIDATLAKIDGNKP